MYLVIVGAGKVGLPLASSLINEGHEVYVIDRNEEAVNESQRELGMVATVGDATQPSALKEAGLSRADVLISATDSDEDNLAACQLAKIQFKVPRTIAIAHAPENAELFDLAGIDLVVSATDLVLSNLTGTVVDKKLTDTRLPYGTKIVLLINTDGHTKSLDHDSVIEAEDEIIALSPTNSTAELWEILTELR